MSKKANAQRAKNVNAQAAKKNQVNNQVSLHPTDAIDLMHAATKAKALSEQVMATNLVDFNLAIDNLLVAMGCSNHQKVVFNHSDYLVQVAYQIYDTFELNHKIPDYRIEDLRELIIERDRVAREQKLRRNRIYRLRKALRTDYPESESIKYKRTVSFLENEEGKERE